MEPEDTHHKQQGHERKRPADDGAVPTLEVANNDRKKQKSLQEDEDSERIAVLNQVRTNPKSLLTDPSMVIYGNDKDIVLEALNATDVAKTAAKILESASDALKKDWDVCAQALARTSSAIHHVTAHLLDHEEFVTTVVLAKDQDLVKHISDRLKEDMGIMLLATQNGKSYNFLYAKGNLTGDKELVLKLLDDCWDHRDHVLPVMRNLSEELRADQEVAIKAVETNGSCIAPIITPSRRLSGNNEENNCKYVISDTLTQNLEVLDAVHLPTLQEALAKDPHKYFFLPKELQMKPRLAKCALEKLRPEQSATDELRHGSFPVQPCTDPSAFDLNMTWWCSHLCPEVLDSVDIVGVMKGAFGNEIFRYAPISETVRVAYQLRDWLVNFQELPEEMRNNLRIVEAALFYTDGDDDEMNQVLPHASDRIRTVFCMQSDASTFPQLSEDLRGEKDVAAAAVKRDSNMLQHVPEPLRSDGDFLLNILAENYESLLRNVPANLQTDIKFVYDMIAKMETPALFERLSDEVRSHGAVALKAIEKSTECFAMLPELLRQDPKFLLRVVSRVPLCIQQFSFAMRNDKDIVQRAASLDPKALQYASLALRSSKDFILQLAPKGVLLQFLTDSLRNDKQVVLDVLKHAPQHENINNPTSPAGIWVAPQLLHGSRKQALTHLEHASERLRADKEVVLTTLSRFPSAFKHASDQLKADREVALAALAAFPSVMKHVAESLQANPDFVLEAIDLNPAVSKELNGSVLWNNLDFIKRVFQYVSEDESKLGVAKYAYVILLGCARALVLNQNLAISAVDAGINILHVLRVVRNYKVSNEEEAESLNTTSAAIENYRAGFLRQAKKPIDPEESLIRHASDELRADREFMLEVVRFNPAELLHCSAQLQLDHEVVLAALDKDETVMRFIGGSLRNDPVFLSAALDAQYKKNKRFDVKAFMAGRQLQTRLRSAMRGLERHSKNRPNQKREKRSYMIIAEEMEKRTLESIWLVENHVAMDLPNDVKNLIILMTDMKAEYQLRIKEAHDLSFCHEIFEVFAKKRISSQDIPIVRGRRRTKSSFARTIR